MTSVLIPLAEGFEELEAMTMIDLLRRAEIEVVTATLGANPVTGAHGVPVLADATLDEAGDRDYDMVALPGGLPGATNLGADQRVRALLARHAAAGRFTAAICAAPSVLAQAGLLEGRRATSYPGFLDADSVKGLKVADEPVVVDGKVVTSRGPGTAMDFALELVAQLGGPGAREAVEKPLLRPQRAGA